MERREAFLKWVRETFGSNAFFTPLPSTLQKVEEEWEEWEDALIVWGALSGEEGYEEALAKLRSLSPEEVFHIGEGLKSLEEELLK